MIMLIRILFLVLILLLLVSDPVLARRLSSESVAIGVWKIQLRGADRQLLESELFPPASTTTIQKQGETAPNRSPLFFWRRRTRNCSCRLSVFPNGTFTLEPPMESVGVGGGDLHQREEERDGGTPSAAAPKILPVRGQWRLDRNPYCATDRFYDGLVLSSYPRAQKRILKKDAGRKDKLGGLLPEDDAESLTTLKRVRFDLRCRLHGRYTEGGLIRRLVGYERYERGRMTHGTLLREQLAPMSASAGRRKSNDKEVSSPRVPWWKKGERRIVVASFSAKRRITPFNPLMDLD